MINFLPFSRLYSSGGYKEAAKWRSKKKKITKNSFNFMLLGCFSILWFRSPLIFLLFFLSEFFTALSHFLRCVLTPKRFILFVRWYFFLWMTLWGYFFFNYIHKHKKRENRTVLFCVRSTNKLRFAHILCYITNPRQNVLNDILYLVSQGIVAYFLFSRPKYSNK